MMTRTNHLSTLCFNILSDISVNDGESRSLMIKTTCCLWATGADRESIQQITGLQMKSFIAGGRRAISALTKGWSNAIRSILSLSPFDTSVVGYCKQARNCRFALRRLGATPLEIDTIVSRYDGLCGIPPLLLLEPYWRILLPGRDISLYQKVAPLANLGRASPSADKAKCIESEVKFFETTGRVPDFQFDLSELGRRYGSICRTSSRSSHIPLNSHASLRHNRGGDGGKTTEFMTGVVDNYLTLTIDQLVHERPNSDLYDVFGNLVLRSSDWRVGTPITEVMYLDIGYSSTGLDRRLGLFGLDWAIRKLDQEYPDCVHSDSPFLTFGSFPPNLCFDGKLPARVCTLAEEGYKARVITITEFFASIITGVARFFVDNSVRSDRNVQIGILAGVKLYNFLVHLNGGERRGIDSFEHPSVFFRTALSADLTTATDTAPRDSCESLLRGFTQVVSNLRSEKFLYFALEVGCSPRGFQSRISPPGHVHNCGIMMGEGWSGVYLNVISGIVRAVLRDFMVEFDYYSGHTSEEARKFIFEHDSLIQEFFNTVEITSFGENSTQSGDDLLDFSQDEPEECRRFLILLYVSLGLVPSESTFYSSEYFALFTEEMAIRHSLSLGWTFVDCIKPRLYSITSVDGIASILSHISQITRSLGYVKDIDYINRVCDVVDSIIELNPVIRDRVTRYQLVPSFPSFLGGLNHPLSLLEGTEYIVPLVDRELVMKLLSCSLEELFEVKYSWVSDDLPNDEDAKEIRESIIYLFRQFQQLPLGDEYSDTIIEGHRYSEEMLLDRGNFPSYNTYRAELVLVKQELGLANLDDLVGEVSKGIRLRQQAEGSSISECNPLITLRNRREFLIARTADLMGDPYSFEWSSLKSISWRLNTSYQGQFVVRESFLDILDFLDLPSLNVPIPPFDG